MATPQTPGSGGGRPKGGLPIGTVRVWHGQKFIKRGPGQWVKVSDKLDAQGSESFQVQRRPIIDDPKKPKAGATKKPEPKSDKPAEKPLDHKKAPNLNLNFHDQMAPEPGKGRHVSLSKDQLGGLLKDGNFGFISAGRNPANEVDKKLTDEQIEQRYDKLRQDLQEAGYKFTEITGHYGAPEKSFLVVNPDRGEMSKLGKKYNQDSVIFGDQGKQEMLFTTGENEGKSHFGEGWKEVPDAEDFYSEVPLTNGQRMKFSLNFDFGKMHEDPDTTWKAKKEGKVDKPSAAKKDLAETTHFDED